MLSNSASAQAELPPLVLGPRAPDWVTRTLDDSTWGDGGTRRQSGRFAEARLERLLEADQLRQDAVRATASARDDEALRLLTRARSLLESLSDVPGAVAYLVEVHLLTARVAHAAGMSSLFDESIARAALLEPDRRLRAGEASPDVLDAAAHVHSETRARAPGRFDVFVRDLDGPVDGARVFIDDQPVATSRPGDAGGGPSWTVEAPSGPHLLRIDAPGHRTRGFSIDVLPGERSAQVFRIGLVRLERLARTARRVARRGERQPLLDVLGEHSAWIIEPSRDGRRALVRQCNASGCGAAVRWTMDETPPPPPGPPETDAGALPALDREDAAWLMGTGTLQVDTEQTRDARQRRRSNRWPAWLAVSLGVVGGGLAAAIVAARPGPAPALRTTVDFGDLAPR